MKTVYTNLLVITELQQKIMRYVDYWSHVVGTPIKQKDIVKEMKERGCKRSTVVNALNGLLRSGYIRRTVLLSNSSAYVQLRRL